MTAAISELCNLTFTNNTIHSQIYSIDKDASSHSHCRIAEDELVELDILGEPETINPKMHLKSLDNSCKYPNSFEAITKRDSRDSKITATAQGGACDCWLLSAVNALSYTNAGKDLIKNSITWHKNDIKNVATVNLFGVAKVTISHERFREMQGANYYSNGDKDMLAFELAFSSISLAMQLGAFKIDTDFTNNHAENVDGGNAQEAFYMLTGKCPENTTDKGAINKLLNTFQKNCDRDFAVCATRHIKEDKQVKDIDGKSITIYGNHVYAVKRADGDSVTIVNPHDSGKKNNNIKKNLLGSF